MHAGYSVRTLLRALGATGVISNPLTLWTDTTKVPSKMVSVPGPKTSFSGFT